MIRAFVIIYTLLAALVLGFYALSDRPGWLEPRPPAIWYSFRNTMREKQDLEPDYLREILDLPEHFSSALLQNRLESRGVDFPPGSNVVPFFGDELNIAMSNTMANHQRLTKVITKNLPAEVIEDLKLNDPFISKVFLSVYGETKWDPLLFSPPGSDHYFGIKESVYFKFELEPQPHIRQIYITTLSLGDWTSHASTLRYIEQPGHSPLVLNLPCAAWGPLLVLTVIPALILTSLRKPLARSVRFIPIGGLKK